jgi:integrase
MATKALTHTMVQAAKAGAGTRLELWDASTPGLCLRVTDKGAKSWVLRYHSKAGGQPRYKIGDARRMDLRSARAEAWRLKEEIAKGIEPAAARRQAREAAEAQPIRTFNDLLDAYEKACEAGEWKPKKKRKRPQTIAFEKRLTERHIRPALGKKPVDAVTRPVVKGVLRSMIAGDAGTGQKPIGAQTNRVHAIIRQAFNWAISEEVVESNPAMGFASFHDDKPRPTIWSDGALKKLWRACASSANLCDSDGRRVYVSRCMAIAVQLSALTLQRRVEVAHMAVDELDLAARTWLIPGERMKGGKPHQVPFGPRAANLIEEAIKLGTDEGGKRPRFVFPSPRDPGVPVREDSVTKALAKIRSAIGVEDSTVHDLRRTGSTVLTSERLGVSPFIRSKVLGHGTDAGGGAAVSSTHYDVNLYLPEKRRALEAWENLLLEIVGERVRPENVSPMREAVP